MIFTDSTYGVALFGHRDLCEHNALDEKLYPLIKEIICSKDFVEIYIGRNGEFDIYSATIVKRIQREIGNDKCNLICVLPYRQKDVEYYAEYYDDVYIPEALQNVHPKRAITLRNQLMVEMSDLVIAYVKRKNGGAYTAMKYAEKLHRRVINLYRELSENV